MKIATLQGFLATCVVTLHCCIVILSAVLRRKTPRNGRLRCGWSIRTYELQVRQNAQKGETLGEKRKRTETLTLRLTAGEKWLLKRKAAAMRKSVTDYIMISALGHTDTDKLFPVLQMLVQVQKELYALKEQGNDCRLDDALKHHSEAVDAVLKVLRK